MSTSKGIVLRKGVYQYRLVDASNLGSAWLTKAIHSLSSIRRKPPVKRMKRGM